MRPVRALAWALFIAGAVAWVLAYVFDSPPYVRPSDLVWASSFYALLIGGLFVTLKVPRNAFGWMMLIAPGLAGLGIALGEAGLMLEGDFVFGTAILTAVTALYLFPDGRLPARIWVAIWIIAVLGMNLAPTLLGSSAPDQVDGWFMTLGIVGAVGSMLTRAVTGGPIVRRQLGLPLLTIVLGFLGMFALAFVPGETEWLGVLPSVLISVGFPASMVVSVIRYRLYELDRIVSRTIAYAVIVSILGLMFAAGALWLPQALEIEEPLFVAATTLLVAALFSPLRSRVQREVDRRFNRTRYDRERVVEAFSSSLRDQTDSDDLVRGWVGVVSETMQPGSVSVWVKGS